MTTREYWNNNNGDKLDFVVEDDGSVSVPHDMLRLMLMGMGFSPVWKEEADDRE